MLVPTSSIKVMAGWMKAAEAEIKKTEKASFDATQLASYKYRKFAKRDLRTGQLGLTPISEYKLRGEKRGKFKYRPLYSLSGGILVGKNKKELSSELGFLGTKLSAKWMREFAEKHLKGYTILLEPRHIVGKTKAHEGIYLRKETIRSVVPPRDIIGAIEKKYKYAMLKDLKDFFNRKYAGEYIGNF